MHGFLGEEGHVFVDGVVGDVGVGGVVEGDEDVEEDCCVLSSGVNRDKTYGYLPTITTKVKM